MREDKRKVLLDISKRHEHFMLKHPRIEQSMYTLINDIEKTTRRVLEIMHFNLWIEYQIMITRCKSKTHSKSYKNY